MGQLKNIDTNNTNNKNKIAIFFDKISTSKIKISPNSCSGTTYKLLYSTEKNLEGIIPNNNYNYIGDAKKLFNKFKDYREEPILIKNIKNNLKENGIYDILIKEYKKDDEKNEKAVYHRVLFVTENGKTETIDYFYD